MANASMEELLALVSSKRADIKARSGGFQNANRVPSGKSRWRFLPGWKEFNTFFHDFHQHYIKDKDGKVVAVYVCEAGSYARPCGICDTISDAMRGTKDDSALKVLKEMKGRPVYLVNALRMDGADADPTKPKLLQLPTTVMDDYLALLQERSADEINLLSLEDGRDVIITKEGSGFSTEYKLNDAPKNTKIDVKVMESVIDIDAWIDAEFRKGVLKGTALVESATKTIVALSGGTSALSGLMGSGGSSAKLIAGSNITPSSRIIDAEVEEVAAGIVTVAWPDESKTKTAEKPSGVMNTEELDELLASLDT